MARRNPDYFKLQGTEVGDRDSTAQSRRRLARESAELRKTAPSPRTPSPRGRPGHRPGHEHSTAPTTGEDLPGSGQPSATTGEIGSARPADARAGRGRARGAPTPGAEPGRVGRVEVRGPVSPRGSARGEPGAPRRSIPAPWTSLARLVRGLVRFSIGMAIAPFVIGRLVWQTRAR